MTIETYCGMEVWHESGNFKLLPCQAKAGMKVTYKDGEEHTACEAHIVDWVTYDEPCTIEFLKDG